MMGGGRKFPGTEEGKEAQATCDPANVGSCFRVQSNKVVRPGCLREQGK